MRRWTCARSPLGHIGGMYATRQSGGPMRLVTTALATLALAAIAATGSAQVDTSAAARRQRNIVVPGRSMVTTKLGIVAASQPLAARAGVQMLEQGGNAVDAAIAANAALGLMEPGMNGVGGDLFA